MTYRRALMNDFDTRFLEVGKVGLRVTTRSLNNLHAAFNNGFDVARVIRGTQRGKKGEVYTKGLVGHLFAASNFVGQVFRCLLR